MYNSNSQIKNKPKHLLVAVIVLIAIIILFVIAYISWIYPAQQKNSNKYPDTPQPGFTQCSHTDSSCTQNIPLDEPIIYLYPNVVEKVNIKLGLKGQITSSYPNYNPISGWDVTAHPNGKIINNLDGKEHNYIFWEGITDKLKIDPSVGFVVRGKDTSNFLQTHLQELGLNPTEYNDFIVYWLPKMENNPYNFIQFIGKDYTDISPLEITPKPDSTLRVFMAFKPLEKPIPVKAEVLNPFNRTGFTVVEWGGTELK